MYLAAARRLTQITSPGRFPDVLVPADRAGPAALLHALPHPIWSLTPSAHAATFNFNSDATLRAALTAAVNGDVINFTGNVTVSAADLPAIQRNLALNGNGFYQAMKPADYQALVDWLATHQG